MYFDEKYRRPVIFIHGLGSGKESSKYVALKEQLDPNRYIVDIIESDYSISTRSDIECKFGLMIAKYAQYSEPIVVGHSLGAYWTRVMSNVHYFPSLLVNPSMKPWETFKDQIPVVEYDPVPVSIFDQSTGLSYEYVYIELGDEVVDQQNQIDEGLFLRSDLTTNSFGHHRVAFLDNVVTEVKKLDEQLIILESLIISD